MNFLSEENLEDLAVKKLSGVITPAEDQLLNEFLNKKMDETVIWVSDDADEEALRQRILNSIKQTARINTQRPVYFLKRIAAAAVFLTAVFTGGWYFVNNKKTHSSQPVFPQSQKYDVPPGTNGAILILADGKQITLDSTAAGKIAQQGGAQIIHRNGFIEYDLSNRQNAAGNEGQNILNTISTPRGKQFAIRLSDGTKVWLDAATTLTFPASFSKDERKVFVSGEAYFEVAKSKAKPFRVIINNRDSVEVLGTHFNICAYATEQNSATTLLEGSVKINQQFILKPGQQFQKLTGNRQHIVAVDTAEAVAWKNGMFIYNGAGISTILQQIGRWYDLDIITRGEPVKDKFSGAIPRSAGLETALKVLKYSGVDFSIEGKALIVSSKK